MRLAPRILVACVVAAVVAVDARAATEWVVILDNSASMTNGTQMQGGPDLPPSDPNRLSLLATQIFRAFLDPVDRLTILVFAGPGGFRRLDARPDAIRALVFDQGTYFSGAFREARRILSESSLPERRLLLVTDGAPSSDDALTPEQAQALLGLDAATRTFEITTLGLATSPEIERAQTQFLSPLGGLHSIDSPRKLVTEFTKVYAASIRSKPEVGVLKPGGSSSFTVGRYVTEVLIDMATDGRTGAFDASLTADGRVIAPLETGDSGCETRPCHTYAVFRAPHDPDESSKWTLSLRQSAGPVSYGIILRYDLAAEIVRAPSSARAGEEIEVTAHLTWRGNTFNDPTFFESDGFAATLVVGQQAVPLERQKDGTFVARIALTEMGKQPLRARFVNRWLDRVAVSDFVVEGWLPLTLQVRPDPVDFGTWSGAREPTRRCADLDLTGSVNADRIPLEAVAEGLPDGVALVAPTPLEVRSGTTRVCVESRGCCKDAVAGPDSRIVLRGRDPHYHDGAARVQVALRVEATTFLTCWWRVLAAIAGGLLFLFVVIGFLRPRDFDREQVLRLAKTETALARASARRLRELPGGRRGFYRDARVALDGTGNAVYDPRGAAVVIRATRGDFVVTARATIEQKDPRTRKWEPVTPTEGSYMLRREIAYRCGEFCFRIG
ncbi:MAG: VWA domain-containing protein [Myxococcales bacterium]|nr:VWA domain-containing protein [Myxococcales bacterium]